MRKSRIFSVMMLLMGITQLTAQLQPDPLNGQVWIVESLGGCGLTTDCESNIICMDIMMEIDNDRDLDSYNIWVKYDNTVLSRVNGGDDASCTVGDGGDTDIEVFSGAYRVGGIPTTPYPMQAGVPIRVHTICFNILDEGSLSGSEIRTGGDVLGLNSTVTFITPNPGYILPLESGPLVLGSDFTSCSLLPVELTHFGAKAKGMDALLSWETASEVNNSHFEVERSINGVNFEEIGRVEGSGTIATQSDYFYVDYGVGKIYDKVYYRIKQVDFDGTYSYTHVVSVEFDNQEGSIDIYPNPANTVLNVEIYGDGNHTVDIIDMSGRHINSYSPGVIDLTELHAGVYLVNIKNEQGDLIKSKKIVVIK